MTLPADEAYLIEIYKYTVEDEISVYKISTQKVRSGVLM